MHGMLGGAMMPGRDGARGTAVCTASSEHVDTSLELERLIGLCSHPTPCVVTHTPGEGAM